MRHFREHRKFTGNISTEIVEANYNLRTIKQNNRVNLHNLDIQVFATFPLKKALIFLKI